MPKGLDEATRVSPLDTVLHPRRNPSVVVLMDKLFQYREAFLNDLVDRHGYDVTVVHFGSRRDVPGARFSEVAVGRSIQLGPFSYMHGADEVAERADVVIAMCDPKRVNSLLLSRRRRSYRLILWSHGLGRSALLGKVRVGMIDRADALVLYDEANIREVVDGGVDPGKVFVVPNTIHVPNAQFDSDAVRDTFIFVGRLKKRKGIDLFLTGFADVVRTSSNEVYASIVGSGPERGPLEALAKELGVADRVRFVPATSDPAVLFDEYRRSLAYVSPLHVGLGVLHSFGYGVPVITLAGRQHAPEVNNCQNGRNSFLCKDQSEMIDVMTQLANDPGLSIEVGRRAYDHYVTHRRVDQMAGAMAEVIDRVVDRSVEAASNA